MPFPHRSNWRAASYWLVGAWLLVFAVGASSLIVGARRDSIPDISLQMYAVAVLSLVPSVAIVGIACVVLYWLGPSRPADRATVLRKANRKITAAWIGGAAATATALFAAMQIGHVDGPHLTYQILDACVLAALTYGVYRRSLTAASVLFAYVAISRTVLVAETALEGWLLFLVVFGFIFWRGVVGLLDLRALRRESAAT